jgi:hypothetical protein
MSALVQYLMENAAQVTRDTAGAADVVFFGVVRKEGASAEKLAELIRAHKDEFCAVDLFDGKDHSYFEIGDWIGDQGLALILIGLGSLLGMWTLLSPKSVFGDDLHSLIESNMAGMGYVALQAPRVVAGDPA